MATQVPTVQEPGLASLVGEIVNDIGDLIKQQIQFAQAEVKADLRKSTEAAILCAVGAGSALVSAIFFGLTVVYLLHWMTSPTGVESARLPLWGCHAVVAVLFLAFGAVMFGKGKKLWDSFTPLPVQTVQTMKENVEWITNSK